MIIRAVATIVFATLVPKVAGADLDVLPSGSKALAGSYTLGIGGEGAHRCRVRLRTHGTIGGFELSVPATCAGAVARYGELAAWYVAPNHHLHMADAERHTVYNLRRMNATGWFGEGPDGDALAAFERAYASELREGGEIV